MQPGLNVNPNRIRQFDRPGFKFCEGQLYVALPLVHPLDISGDPHRTMIVHWTPWGQGTGWRHLTNVDCLGLGKYERG
jgi:hypothetical protein